MPMVRSGLLMAMGGFGCLLAQALLSLGLSQLYSLGAGGGALQPLLTVLGLGISALAGIGYLLVIAGGITLQKDVSGSARGLILGTVALMALGLVLFGVGWLVFRSIEYVPEALFGPIMWLGQVASGADAGFAILAIAVYCYFLLALDYSDEAFRQGIFGWVAPGRGFVFPVVIGIFGGLQILMSLSGHGPYWLGNIFLAGASLLALIATANRLPPPGGPIPQGLPPQYHVPPTNNPYQPPGTV